MIRYTAYNVTLVPNIAVGASATNTVVSRVFPISGRGALNCVIKLTAGSVTSSTGITAKLQTSTGYSATFVDSKTVTITGNGDFYIKLQTANSSDQTYLPLLNQGRLVVSSGSGDAATITLVEVVQES